jgi:glycosyltransferase involved in cell wall biosynthesis
MDDVNVEGARVVRVAICATHPIQYQAPLWRRLAGRPDLRVRVFYGCDMSVRGYRDEGFGSNVRWDVPLTDGYDFEFMSTDPKTNRVGFFNPNGRGLETSMRRFEPDVTLLTAYNGLFSLRALRAAARLSSATVMRHEATDLAVTRRFVKSAIRDRILRRIYARVDRFAAIGTNAVQHLSRLGVPHERIGRSGYCVDSEFLAAQKAAWCPRRDELRAGLGISADDVAFLFSGKLIQKKDPLLIPSALERLPEDQRARTHVIIAGDGELRASLESALRGIIGNRTHSFGFKNQSEIGRAYALSDYLILPSKRGAGETWGLVVNEAMQFGLPAIVSDAVGCHPDLVRDGVTGWTFAAGDSAALAAKMRLAIEMPFAGRIEMTRAAELWVAAFSLPKAADGLVEAIHSVARA